MNNPKHQTLRESMHHVSRVLSPEGIARLWVKTGREFGFNHVATLALSEALDWRHTDPQRLREEALEELA